MAKKKSKKKREKLWMPPVPYDDVPSLKGIISKNNWDFIAKVNHSTLGALVKEWKKHQAENIKNGMWKKHKAIVDDCNCLCQNKAVIGIGAGRSFNINKDVLKRFVNNDGLQPWEDRNFITIASNHQFKPLLKMGIIPDFVILIDGSDVVYDQLIKDIPKIGHHTVLLAGLHCSPKVLKEWTEAGREIRFYLNPSLPCTKQFRELTGIDPKPYTKEMGGNVMNASFMLGLTVFGSSVFISVGNDLSFEMSDDKEVRKGSYYADGDYSSNIGTGRDEAKSEKKWAGFKLTDRSIWTQNKDRYDVKLDIVGTTHTLWVYKTWIESMLARQEKAMFHYYNCSEGGIMGVMAKSDKDEDLGKQDNWFLLDDVCKFYHTAKLKDVLVHFLKAKEILECKPQKQPSIIIQNPNRGLGVQGLDHTDGPVISLEERTIPIIGANLVDKRI